MLQTYCERVYTGDDYSFSVVEVANQFTVGICSTADYYEKERPEFYLINIYKKEDGYSLEKIETMLDSKDFLYDAIKIYSDLLLESKKGRKINAEFQAERFVEKVTEAVQASSSVTCWTLEEASAYSKIGINRLRAESLKKGCPWVLWVADTKRLVKIDAFKEWLKDRTYIE